MSRVAEFERTVRARNGEQVEFARRDVEPADVPDLVRVYWTLPDWVARAELVNLLADQRHPSMDAVMRDVLRAPRYPGWPADLIEITQACALAYLYEEHASQLPYYISNGREALRRTVDSTLSRLGLAVDETANSGPGTTPGASVADPPGAFTAAGFAPAAVTGAVMIARSGTRAVAIEDRGRRVRAHDLTGRTGPVELTGHEDRVSAVAISPGGRWAAGGEETGKVRVWDLTGGLAPLVLRGHDAGPAAMAFSPDGGRLISGDVHGQGWVWELADGGAHRRLGQHTGTIDAVALSAGGAHAVTGCSDGLVRIWDPAGSTPRTFAGHETDEGGVYVVRVSADGARVLSGGADATVRVWRPDEGGGSLVLGRHREAVLIADLAASGRLAATSAGWDRRVNLWDLDRAERIMQWRVADKVGNCVIVSEDPLTVAVAPRDGVPYLLSRDAPR